jgi:hypothetical protein
VRVISAPHPLAAALIERLHPSRETRILEFASGSGRNTDALSAAGFEVVAIDEATARSDAPFAGIAGGFEAAISTHGLLHGTVTIVAVRLREIGERLNPGGLLYATFGSTRDARFGAGERIDDSTYAPLAGDERGVAHAYYDRRRLRTLLEESFAIESLDERKVDDVAGRWAHLRRPLHGSVHWFVIARLR